MTKKIGKKIPEEISILHINSAKEWRGGEKQTLLLASSLHKKGYKSYCICQKNSPLHRKLKNNNIPHFPIRIRSEFDLIAAIKIARIIKNAGTDILHMHTSHSHSIGLLSNLLCRVPVNIVSRRVDFSIRRNIFSRIKYSFPHIFISVSNAIRDILIQDGIPAKKVVTIYSGVDFDLYKNLRKDILVKEFSTSENIKDCIKLVNVAALSLQKDHETLIRAMDIVIKNNKNIILFIVGEGDLKRDLIRLRHELNLNDHIFFTGFRDDVLDIIGDSDIFVMSSRWEGLGTSIIDAMALKKPVIATRTGGIPELIEDGVEGILVEKEDPAALAESILKVIKDRSLAQSISEMGYNKAKAFSIENTINKTLELYRSFISV